MLRTSSRWMSDIVDAFEKRIRDALGDIKEFLIVEVWPIMSLEEAKQLSRNILALGGINTDFEIIGLPNATAIVVEVINRDTLLKLGVINPVAGTRGDVKIRKRFARWKRGQLLSGQLLERTPGADLLNWHTETYSVQMALDVQMAINLQWPGLTVTNHTTIVELSDG